MLSVCVAPLCAQELVEQHESLQRLVERNRSSQTHASGTAIHLPFILIQVSVGQGLRRQLIGAFRWRERHACGRGRVISAVPLVCAC